MILSKADNIEIAAFITACGGDNLNIQEIIGLTKAMVGSGQSLSWNKKMVVDKHCRLKDNTIKGHPHLPQFSTDCLETMTKIDLSIKQIQK
jgi:thymidine phosphorylase